MPLTHMKPIKAKLSLLQNFTKDRKTLQTVKFGYVVFEEKSDAQRLVKEGAVSLTKEKATIRLREMGRETSM